MSFGNESLELDVLAADPETPPAGKVWWGPTGLKPGATTSAPGFMSVTDKTKLDNMSANGSGDDWISGLAITAKTPNDRKVAFTLGTYMVNGLHYAIASGGDYNLENGYQGANYYSVLGASQRAVVLLYVDVDQVMKGVVGAASSEAPPPLPVVPVDVVSLAFILISKNGGGSAKNIGSKDITDCRLSRRAGIDEAAKISVNDTTSGFLRDKLTDNGNIAFTKENADANESLKADVKSLGITDAHVAAANKDGVASTASMRTLGTGATQACGGADSRLSDDRTASGLRSATTVVAVSSAAAPTAGQVLTATGGTGAQWQNAGSTTISSSEATATGTTTTTSATDVLMNAMTLTPGAGTYLAMFSSSLSHSTTQSIHVSLYANSVRKDESERRLNVVDLKVQGSEFPVAIQSIVTVGAGQAIEVKWHTTGATATAYQRTLTLIKIG